MNEPLIFPQLDDALQFRPSRIKEKDFFMVEINVRKKDEQET